jgi:hypothetical protein
MNAITRDHSLVRPPVTGLLREDEPVAARFTHAKLQSVHALKYTLELSPSVFDLLTLGLWSTPLRNRVASKFLSSFPVLRS